MLRGLVLPLQFKQPSELLYKSWLQWITCYYFNTTYFCSYFYPECVVKHHQIISARLWGSLMPSYRQKSTAESATETFHPFNLITSFSKNCSEFEKFKQDLMQLWSRGSLCCGVISLIFFLNHHFLTKAISSHLTEASIHKLQLYDWKTDKESLWEISIFIVWLFLK